MCTPCQVKMHFRELIIDSRDTGKQKSFYSGVPGIDIVSEDDQQFRIMIGSTSLTIRQNELATPYHYAINIPSDQITDAVHFLKENNISIICDGENEIVDFSNWNAESVYFHDADKNIVELIARKNLEIKNKNKFSGGSFVSISEIGIAVENVENCFREINKYVNAPVYWGNFNVFCAAGDEQGLFIIIDKKRKNWFPSGATAYSSPFVIDCGSMLQFKDGIISLVS